MPDGRQRVRTERVAAEPAEALAGLLDLDLTVADGAVLPPLWHWLYLLDRRPQRDLGADGHPSSGLPAAPQPGQRRMFAGGRISFRGRLIVGAEATKQTSVRDSVSKQGRTGPLTFVTVRHTITQDGVEVIREEQDIVYRESGGAQLPQPAGAAESAAAGQPEPAGSLSLQVDEPLLFRFSALTYNAHRIHYDLPYARSEGYQGLVIHGPLQVLLMAELHRRGGVEVTGRTLSYRLRSPAVGPQRLTAGPQPRTGGQGSADLEVRTAAGVVCAVSTLSPR